MLFKRSKSPASEVKLLTTYPMILCTVLALGGLAPSVDAGTMVLNDVTRGWFTPAASTSGVAGDNYRAGFCPGPPTGCQSGPAEFRNFFTFAIPQLDGPVVSAALVLSTAGVSTVDSPSMTYQITSIPAVFGFNDLGTGTVYGSRVYTAADGASSPAAPQGTNQSISLDPAGIAAIASNTTFGIGGRITTLGSNPTNEFIFDSSGKGVCPACIAELQITTRTTVPEPATSGFFVAGIAGLWAFRKTKEARRG